MPTASVFAFALALCAALWIVPVARARRVFLVSLLGLLLSLVAQSTPRVVGDAREYALMAVNFAHAESPGVTDEELARVGALLPGATGEGLAMPQLRGADGRQSFPHFWFYSLLAAPFVGAQPIAGFTTLNILLLLAAAVLLVRRVTLPTAALVVAGPILWWIDKPHTEVLTLVMTVVALVEFRRAPHWSILAFAVAALQNPPFAGAMVLTALCAFALKGWSDRRISAAAVAGVAVAALHPLYYYAYLHLGVWTGMYETIDRHLPSWREIFTVPFDPNLGIFVHDPALLAAMLVAVVSAATHPESLLAALLSHEPQARGRLRPRLIEYATLALIVILFLVSFTQTTNFNNGATPGPSRYGLWLVPFVIPMLSGTSGRERWARALASVSVVWCAWTFAPALPEQYLRPTRFATWMWQRWPELDDPLAEVFAERAGGGEPAHPPMATPGCEKVLLWDDGTGVSWPKPCTPVAVPALCQGEDVLCYANRRGDSYAFVRARSSPVWQAVLKQADEIEWLDATLAVGQRPGPRVPVALVRDDGWSYPERLDDPSADVVAREWRWIGDRAALNATPAQRVTARLRINARALGKPRRIRLSAAGAEIGVLRIGENPAPYETPDFVLPAGTTRIDFESLDGVDSPGPGDPRRLSVAVFRVELVVLRTEF